MNKILKLWQKPSAQELAKRELEDAKRYLLRHQSQQEYAQQMCVYYEKCIRRLSAFIGEGK